MKNRSYIIKWAVLSVLLYVVLSLQTALFPRLPLLGATPSLAPCLVALVAEYEGRGAIWYALLAGVLADLLFGGGGYNTLCLTLLALGVGAASNSFPGAGFFAALFISVMAVLCFEVLSLLLRLALGRAVLSALWTQTLPRLLYSVIVSPFLGLAVSGISSLFRRSRREGRYGR